jgi:hypothetical protein
LFDIAADRVECHDLAAKYPDVVRKLTAKWEAWAHHAHVDQWTGPRRTTWGEELKPANK